MKVVYIAPDFSLDKVRRIYLKAFLFERYKVFEVNAEGRTIRVTKLDLPEATVAFGYAAALAARGLRKDPVGLLEIKQVSGQTEVIHRFDNGVLRSQAAPSTARLH